MKTVTHVVALILIATSTTLAQEKPAPPPQEKAPTTTARASEGPRPVVPLKVQIVLSRMKGEKKIASLPYTLSVTSNDRTNLRMGIDVPITGTTPGYNYRSVGTNIDCIANLAAGDAYKLNITVEDSSIHLDTKASELGTSAVAQNIPAFRTFKSNFALVLRDGQSGQFTSAIDPISGEVLKIDVTLNVLK
jgi:hypothetical protein